MTTTRTELSDQIAAAFDMGREAAEQAVDVYLEQLEVSGTDVDEENAEHVRQAVAAERAVSSHAPLDAVIEATAAKAASDADASEADAEWRAAIRAAVAAGERVAEIAAAAGISAARVYQIRDGQR